MAGYDSPDRELLEFMNLAIIREIYDGENAHEVFENELDRAIETKCSTIVIEPTKLGEQTARWISIGNCLHKTAVLSGFGSLISFFTCPDKMFICCPLSVISLVCTGTYALSWQTDPCCKYQVETNPKNLEKLPLHTLSSASPVVLVRKDDTRRSILQTTIALLAVALCAWRTFKPYRSA